MNVTWDGPGKVKKREHSFNPRFLYGYDSTITTLIQDEDDRIYNNYPLTLMYKNSDFKILILLFFYQFQH